MYVCLKLSNGTLSEKTTRRINFKILKFDAKQLLIEFYNYNVVIGKTILDSL